MCSYCRLLTPLVQALIRDLEQSVRVLSDQVKFLTMNAPPSVPGPHVQLQHSSSPGASGPLHQGGPIAQSHLRQVPVTQGPTNYGQTHPPYQQQQSPPNNMQGPSWYSTGIAAPQASHPLAPPPPPPPPPPQTQRSPPAQSQREEWDDTYLAVLGTQDPRQLRELLSRSNPEVVMPLNGTGPLSQAVVLTLLHRVCLLCSPVPLNIDPFCFSLQPSLAKHLLTRSSSSRRCGGYNVPLRP